MGLHSRKPKAGETKAAPVKPSSDMDELEELDLMWDDVLHLDIDKWMRKVYPEIRDAADELPMVMEQINQGIGRAGNAIAVDSIKFAANEAKAYSLLRQEWSTKFADKMTEKALDMAIAQDEALNKEKERIAVLKVIMRRLVNMQENVRAKLEAMRSVESTRRKLVNDGPGD